MSNGARHALGLVAGIVLTPLVAAGLFYGVGEFTFAFKEFKTPWLGFGTLVVTAVLLGFMFSSRLSPVATLLGGLGFTLLGVVPFVEVSTGIRLLPSQMLPVPLHQGMLTLLFSGTVLVLGVAMLVGSLFPSRWRGARSEPGYGTAPPYTPAYVPPNPNQPPPAFQPQPTTGSEDATRPMHRE